MKINVTAHCQTENLVERNDITGVGPKKTFDFGTKRKTNFTFYTTDEWFTLLNFKDQIEKEAKRQLLNNLVKNSKEHLIGKIHYKFHFEEDV
jgi:hypothetical protein